MQVLKKYAQLIDFIKIFNKYNDANTLINISEEDYNILVNFAAYINDPSYIPDAPSGEPGDKGPTGDKGPGWVNSSGSLPMEVNWESTPFLTDWNSYTVGTRILYDNGDIYESYDNTYEDFSKLRYITNIKGPTGDKGPAGDSGQIDGNIITSNVNGLQIDVVDSMPENPNDNTLYIIQ